MTGAEFPTTIIGLVGLAIVTIGGIVHLRIQQSVQGRKVSEVHEQVRNDHGSQPNLRDDIDDIRGIVRDIQDRTIASERDVTGMRLDVHGLRQELHDERDRSISTDDRILGELRDERERSIITDNELLRHIDELRGEP